MNRILRAVLASSLSLGLAACVASPGEEAQVGEADEALIARQVGGDLGGCTYVNGVFVCDTSGGGSIGANDGNTQTCGGQPGVCVSPSHCTLVQPNNPTGGQVCTIGDGMCLSCESGTVIDNGQTYVRCNSTSTAYACPQQAPQN